MRFTFSLRPSLLPQPVVGTRLARRQTQPVRYNSHHRYRQPQKDDFDFLGKVVQKHPTFPPTGQGQPLPHNR
jgi:hypothetical protein